MTLLLKGRHARVFLVGCVLVLGGCGPRDPTVYPVKGKIINKGKGQVRDMAGYNVQLQSTTDPEEAPGGAIAEDGTFVLSTYTRIGGKVIPGVKEGTYRACILPPPVEGGPPPRLVIPVRYTKLETSNLQFTIKPGENEISIEVER